uniref:Uncharacterized protein n=1 Tax=Plectus sambesii TaxID=2011161 RepID=A0A914W6J3_9BILA
MGDLLVYVVYLFLQRLFFCMQKVYWLAFGLDEPPKDAPIRLMSILYRRMLNFAESPRWEDFVASHKAFAPISLLDDNHWG